MEQSGTERRRALIQETYNQKLKAIAAVMPVSAVNQSELYRQVGAQYGYCESYVRNVVKGYYDKIPQGGVPAAIAA